LETCRYLAGRGVGVSYVMPDSEGVIGGKALLEAVRPGTRLVSVMAANNVVGTLQPVKELGEIAHEQGAWFHTDAVQAAGKIPLDVKRLPVDLVSLSAHKFHGPKGVGALYVRRGTPLSPLVYGGGQERGLRSATENVAGIVGMGVAADIAREMMVDEVARLVRLRDHLIDSVLEVVRGAYLVGHRYRRLPGHVCMGVSGMEGAAISLLLALDGAGVCVSTGSACSASHAAEPSYVLTAMGFDVVRARGSIRITLGRFNTREEVERFLEVLWVEISRLMPTASRIGKGKA